MARVVVTGGAGFLGSHLCRALLDRGDEVVALDNLVTGAVANIEELFGRTGFTFVEHDVSNYIWVPGDVDVVMHLASPASPADFERIPIQILKVGGLGTHNALGLAKAKGAKFFLASTSEVYGDPLVHPQPEEYWGNVNPIGPRGVYDEAKRYAEAMTMAYHRHHDVDVRIVRIFNSILADEQVLYDDGSELHREPIGELAARLAGSVDLRGYTVPAFGTGATIHAAEATALVGHPPTGPCYEVRTRYGRSIRVTGDHSLFAEGPDGQPVARTVAELAIGDHIAIAGRVEVPERDRSTIDTIELLERAGFDEWNLRVEWDGLGEIAWERRVELLHVLQGRFPNADRRSRLWPRVIAGHRSNALTVAEVRRLGLPIPDTARVSARSATRGGRLPTSIEVTDEMLWLCGLWVAEGTSHASTKSNFISISTEEDELDRAVKVIERDLDLHVVRAPATPVRAGAIYVHGRAVLALWEQLGFPDNRKRIPGWILGLPLARLKWFIEGYREGDGVHSGKKYDEQKRHEFSTVSTELKDDLIVALGRFGVCPSVGQYRTRNTSVPDDPLRPFWRLTVCDVAPWNPLSWDTGVVQRLNARRTGDLVWAQVTSIDEITPTERVYDFCVPGRENFYAGTGIMAHNTYGPRMRPDDGRAVSNFVVQALRNEPITIFGDGSQTRSFTYVDDEIRGFLALLDSDQATPINIGNDNEFTIAQLADLVLEITGSDSEIVHLPLPVDDPTQRKPDLTKARTLLGWEPSVQLRDGLIPTIEYFRSLG